MLIAGKLTLRRLWTCTLLFDNNGGSGTLVTIATPAYDVRPLQSVNSIDRAQPRFRLQQTPQPRFPHCCSTAERLLKPQPPSEPVSVPLASSASPFPQAIDCLSWPTMPPQRLHRQTSSRR